MKQCNWCDKAFRPSVSYQIYCSTECRDESTKEKIAERHKILRRKKRKDKTRFCASGCGTKLSLYNEDKVCNTCAINSKQVNKKIKEIKDFMNEHKDKRKTK